MTSKKIFGAMFDIRPTKPEDVNVAKKEIPEPVLAPEPTPEPKPESTIEPKKPEEDNELQELQKGAVEEREIDIDVAADEITQIVSSVGGSIHTPEAKDPPRRPGIKKSTVSFKKEIDTADIQAVDFVLPDAEKDSEDKEEIHPESSNEVNVWLNRMEELPVPPTPPPAIPGVIPKLATFSKYKAAILIAVIAFAGFYASNIYKAKNSGEQAMANLESAKINLENFEFQQAAINFSVAKGELEIVSRKLSLLGLDFVAAFKNIPGLDKANSAKHLVSAGEELAKAGESLASSLGRLSSKNFFSYFGLDGGEKKSLSILVDSFKKPILQAQLYLGQADNSLQEVDDSIIPEDKREMFNELKEKLPLFEGFIEDAVEYSDFLSSVVGEGSSKKYLLLFQNTSEVRATGGFPGSYALITLEKGYFEDILVDDIYNPDGQLKEGVIPPKPLQHITPTWGMRDANWFADFPTSAFKVAEFYKKGSGGTDVDGVFSVTPDVIKQILEIIGGIEVPDYGVTLNAENFLQEIQNEVEYGDREDGEHSKVILTDFTPLLLEKLSQLSQDKWLAVSEILIGAISKKQIMAYFTDPVLQSIAVKNDFGGEVKTVDGDYLSIIHSNVKGSKTDAYMDTTIKVETSILGTYPKHKVTITRKHNGGNTEYGFYNRTNPDYVRVLVPKGSKLLSIEGADKVDYKPLVSYNNSDFVVDPDLEAYESTRRKGENNVEFLEESGKDEFAFWMVIAPGKEETVVLEYASPIETFGDYSLYIQKQSGMLNHKIEYSFEIPSNLNLIYKSPYLSVQDGKVILSSDLNEDRVVEIRLR